MGSSTEKYQRKKKLRQNQQDKRDELEEKIKIEQNSQIKN